MKKFLVLVSIALCTMILFIYVQLPSVADNCRTGKVSWYGGGEKLNPRTASGEVFDPDAMTAASPYREDMGGRFVVRYGKKEVIVRVNDYGPNRRLNRTMDLARKAAERLGIISRGVVTAEVCRI
jgi:rare lipoprotein A